MPGVEHHGSLRHRNGYAMSVQDVVPGLEIERMLSVGARFGKPHVRVERRAHAHDMPFRRLVFHGVEPRRVASVHQKIVRRFPDSVLPSTKRIEDGRVEAHGIDGRNECVHTSGGSIVPRMRTRVGFVKAFHVAAEVLPRPLCGMEEMCRLDGKVVSVPRAPPPHDRTVRPRKGAGDFRHVALREAAGRIVEDERGRRDAVYGLFRRLCEKQQVGCLERVPLLAERVVRGGGIGDSLGERLAPALHAGERGKSRHVVVAEAAVAEIAEVVREVVRERLRLANHCGALLGEVLSEAFVPRTDGKLADRSGGERELAPRMPRAPVHGRGEVARNLYAMRRDGFAQRADLAADLLVRRDVRHAVYADGTPRPADGKHGDSAHLLDLQHLRDSNVGLGVQNASERHDRAADSLSCRRFRLHRQKGRTQRHSADHVPYRLCSNVHLRHQVVL